MDSDFRKSLSKDVQNHYPTDSDFDALDSDFEAWSSDLEISKSVCFAILSRLRIAISNFWDSDFQLVDSDSSKSLYQNSKITVPGTAILLQKTSFRRVISLILSPPK